MDDIKNNGQALQQPSEPNIAPNTESAAELEKGPVMDVAAECPFLVRFAIPADPDNPKDWPLLKKWAVTSVMSASGFNRIMVSTIMAPALSTIAIELDMTSIESVMAMSVYLLATAFGPLAIGPLSEVYGRTPVLHLTNIWFLGWNIVCGFANSKGLLIAARLLAGFGASAIYALGSGVLGDVWRPEQRGRSLALYLLIPLLAAAVGPIIGGYITAGTNWRWIFWSTSCIQAVMIVASYLLFRETHAPTILYKRAQRLRDTTGESRYYTTAEVLDGERSAFAILQRSLTRPLRLLLFHPVIQIKACLSAFSYGVLYLVLSSFSELWTSQYNEPVSTSALHYFAVCIGEVIGAQTAGTLMDMVFQRLRARANGAANPEFHMPLMLPAAVLAPAGLLLYGWAAQAQAFWLVVDVGVALLSFGMQVVGQVLQAYIIDAYPDHVGSASAASQFLSSLTAFAFPLFAPAMYAALGYGWGNTIMAFAAAAICVPAPVLIWIYGPRLRARAKSSY